MNKYRTLAINIILKCIILDENGQTFRHKKGLYLMEITLKILVKSHTFRVNERFLGTKMLNLNGDVHTGHNCLCSKTVCFRLKVNRATSNRNWQTETK